MIELFECPNCGKDSAAFTAGAGRIYCPACSPTPDKEPHDYTPIMLAGIALRDCCGDAADCGHECGNG